MTDAAERIQAAGWLAMMADDAPEKSTTRLRATTLLDERDELLAEIERLQREVRRWEQQQIRPQEVIDRLQASEARVARLETALAGDGE